MNKCFICNKKKATKMFNMFCDEHYNQISELIAELKFKYIMGEKNENNPEV